MKQLAEKFLLLALLLTASLQSYAITLHGTDVDFIIDDVAYAASLFGPATVVGNSIFFQPTAFSAEAQDEEGADSTHQTLIIGVTVTTPGYTMTSFAMVEQGDYIQDGIGASVAASGRLEVIGSEICGPFSFPCMDAGIFNVGPFSDTAGLTDAWSGGTIVDLADTAGWGADTNVSISFQNNLSATTLNNGEYAYIEKKFGAVGLIVNPVPLPAAVWLFASGLLGLIGISRRRRSV